MYMDFFYDDYENEQEEYYNNGNKFDFFIKNKKTIIKIAVFIVIILFLLIYLSPRNRYSRIEEKMVQEAKRYVNDNYINISQEVYFDVNTLNYSLSDNCSNISGVSYNGYDYIPYLYCEKYQSEVIRNPQNSISLNGDSVIVLAKGKYFIDPGYICDSEVNVIGDVGTEEGVYTLYYHNTKNDDVVSRKVIIIDNKFLLDSYPSISLNGNDIVYVFQGDNYFEEGATATDNMGRIISDKIDINGKVNTNIIGEYKLVYSIKNDNGLTNSISRMVNVVNKNMSITFDYIINPTTIVNTSVNISARIIGNDYDYVILPDGKKETNNYINFEVYKNGIYNFDIYDKAGRIINKSITVSNIDKELPLATCDAVIYNNYTDLYINNLSNKNISSYEYQVNNQPYSKRISSSYRYDSVNVNSANVIINDTIGNKNTIRCDISDYNTWKTDFSKSIVFIESESNNDILKKYTFENYLKNAVYKELIGVDLNSLNNNELNNLFKAYFILKKAEVLKKGGYNINLKQLIFKINNANYCDVYTGCKFVSKNSKSFYLSNDIDYNYESVFHTYDKLSDNIINIMDNAYKETKKDVIINNGYDAVLIRYPENFILNDNMKEYILQEVKNNGNYLDIIRTYFNGYKIYNVNSYANRYVDNRKVYWWPIGNNYPINGIYSSTPDSLEIIHTYGASMTDNKIYDYLAIKGECNKTNVISSYNGTVVSVSSNADYGNYVVIDHGNGVRFIYGSLNKNSITVSVGEIVKKGELIGKIDKLNNTCMLYLKSVLNNDSIDPMEYISNTDPRPTGGESIIYVPGNTVKESVCRTLVASGFSTEAVAGIMANIQRESNFNLQSLGDGGTSYGLCQWHEGRWNKLKNHCGNKIDTVECQLDYLLFELKNNYKNVYNYVIGNYSAYDIGFRFCYNYEIPGARDTSCAPRGEIAQNTYVPYVLNGCN